MKHKKRNVRPCVLWAALVCLTSLHLEPQQAESQNTTPNGTQSTAAVTDQKASETTQPAAPTAATPTATTTAETQPTPENTNQTTTPPAATAVTAPAVQKPTTQTAPVVASTAPTPTATPATNTPAPSPTPSETVNSGLFVKNGTEYPATVTLHISPTNQVIQKDVPAKQTIELLSQALKKEDTYTVSASLFKSVITKTTVTVLSGTAHDKKTNEFINTKIHRISSNKNWSESNTDQARINLVLQLTEAAGAEPLFEVKRDTP